LITVTIKSIKISYLNYYNKLVLFKNLQLFNKPKNVKILLKKKTNSKIVTLRAPKHFKVGRHHYQIITQPYFIHFTQFNHNSLITVSCLYNYVNKIITIIKKKKFSKTFSLLQNFKLCINVVDSFVII